MKHAFLFVVLAGLCGSVFAAAPKQPVPTPTPKPVTKPQAPSEQGQEVAYADLAKYIGKRVVVHTKFNTTRSGVLLRRSATEVDLKLDTGAELTVTADSIKRVIVPVGAPDPLFQKPADAAPAKASDVKPADSKPADGKPSGGKPAGGKTGDDSAKKK